MTFDDAVRVKGLCVTVDVADACHLLEHMGFRYGKDFVSGQAVQMAGEAIIELYTGDDRPAETKEQPPKKRVS
jgi:hypothetical protein